MFPVTQLVIAWTKGLTQVARRQSLHATWGKTWIIIRIIIRGRDGIHKPLSLSLWIDNNGYNFIQRDMSPLPLDTSSVLGPMCWRSACMETCRWLAPLFKHIQPPNQLFNPRLPAKTSWIHHGYMGQFTTVREPVHSLNSLEMLGDLGGRCSFTH